MHIIRQKTQFKETVQVAELGSDMAEMLKLSSDQEFIQPMINMLRDQENEKTSHRPGEST